MQICFPILGLGGWANELFLLSRLLLIDAYRRLSGTDQDSINGTKGKPQ